MKLVVIVFWLAALAAVVLHFRKTDFFLGFCDFYRSLWQCDSVTNGDGYSYDAGVVAACVTFAVLSVTAIMATLIALCLA